MELDVSQEIGQILDEFATRFGATGAELWAELVRYQVVGSVMQVVLCAIAALVAWLVSMHGWRKYKETHDDVYGFPTCIGATIAISTTIATFVNSWHLAVTLAAPQAATLRELLP